MKQNLNLFDKLPENTLSERLTKLRKTSGLSQESLAEKLNMDAKAYGKYEQGKTLPPVERIIDLADFYHISCDYILQGQSLPACEEAIHYLTKFPEKEQKKILKILEYLLSVFEE